MVKVGHGVGVTHDVASRDLEAAFGYPVTHGHLSSYYMIYAACCMMLHWSSPTLWQEVSPTWCGYEPGTRSVPIEILSCMNASMYNSQVSVMKVLKLIKVAREIIRMALEVLI
ncbi:hypothetical protein Tco_0589207 [Tanacetum coccineum]